jgi:hypothetical protein
METVMSNQAVAVLSPVSGDTYFLTRPLQRLLSTNCYN